MKTYLESLTDSRRAVAAEMRALAQDATGAVRSLTPDDQSRVNELNARYDRLKAEEDRLRAVTRALAPGDAQRKRISTVITNDGDQGVAPDPIRDMIKDGVPFRDFAPATTESTRDLPDLDWAARPGSMDNVVMAARAISDFANSQSLYIADFMSRVAVYQRSMSPWLRLATVINADNGRPLVVPTLTVDATTVKPGEGTAITASDPTLGSATAIPVSYKSMTYISYEAWEDEETNLSDLVARSHARSIALSFGSDATTAVLAAINNGGTATGLGGGSTATFMGWDDMVDVKYGRASSYRDSGSWVMANGAIRKARKWTDKNGGYLWSSAASVAGQPDTLDGDPVFEDPYLQSPGSAVKAVVYGDVAAGVLIKARALRVAISSDFAFDKDQITVRSVQRLGLVVQDPAALAYLVCANA